MLYLSYLIFICIYKGTNLCLCLRFKCSKTASIIGSIIAAAAALEIHIDKNAVGSINPNIILDYNQTFYFLTCLKCCQCTVSELYKINKRMFTGIRPELGTFVRDTFHPNCLISIYTVNTFDFLFLDIHLGSNHYGYA